MHHARIAMFLLGAWIFGGLVTAYIATEDLQMVDTVLRSPAPEAAKIIQKLANPSSTRQLLRYMAAEQNQAYFDDWEVAQIAIGFLLIGVLFLGVESRMLSALAAAMLLMTL